MEPVIRCMINIEQDCIKLSSGVVGVESTFEVRRERKKIALNKTAACILTKFRPERHQALLVPLNYRV